MAIFEEDESVQEAVLEVIDSNPEYRELIQMMVVWEQENEGAHSNYDYSNNYHDTAWEAEKLPGTVNPGKLGYLARKGIVGKVRDSNSNTLNSLWALQGRDDIEQALRIDKSGQVAKMEQKTIDEDEVPDDIFEPIVGHEDIKELFKSSVATTEPVHILLVGPPACGKTVFLEEVSRLPQTEFMVGSSTTGPGFVDQMFDKKPQNILIDEFDKMDKDDYGNLLSLQEDGMIKETKGNNKRREIQLEGATVYATANRVESIPDENISRFMGDPVIELPEYTDEEFREVTFNVLTMREDVSEEMARCIADVIVDDTDIRDFRECRRLARLAKTEDDKSVEESVMKYVNIIEKYGSSGLLG